MENWITKPSSRPSGSDVNYVAAAYGGVMSLRGTEMDLSATLIELKPNTAILVEDWAEFIKSNLDLALDSIESEGVEIESWFLLQLDGKDYLLCYMRASSMKNAREVGSTSENPVDIFHKHFLKSACVGRVASGRLLVDLATSKSRIARSDS